MRGNITRRGKASWRIKFDVPARPDGERRTQFVTIRGSKKDAQVKLAELLASVGKGTFVEPNKLAVAEHVRARIDVWHSSGKIGDSTRERYRVLLAKQITPHLGGIALQRLTTTEIETWHAKLGSSGLSPRTARHAHAVLRKAFADPVRHDLLPRTASC